MIWKKSKQPADSQQDAAAAPKKGGAAAFAKELEVAGAGSHRGAGRRLVAAEAQGAKPANVDTSYTEATPETGMSPTRSAAPAR